MKLSNVVYFGIMLLITIWVQSCEDKVSAKKGSANKNFPSQIIYNTDIVRRDSGNINLKFRAKIIEKYEYVDSPYVVAKKGFYLEYFDKKKAKKPGKIWADYAVFNEKKNTYEAKGNVRILTSDGTSFKTKSIFWDKNKKEMSTKDSVFVMDNKGNSLVGANGMRAKEDFTEYTFYDNSGDFEVNALPDTKR